MEERISSVIREALTEIGAGEVAFSVERPSDMAHGDYATNVALVAGKQLGKNPKEIAAELAPLLQVALGTEAADVSVAGPGFINIMLSRDAIVRSTASAAEESWGRGTQSSGKSVMIEYGNPNPFKEMHIGHLVGAIIGESMSRLSEYSGANVYRDTFGGDVGPQVAKALWVFLKDGATDIASAEEIGKAYVQGSTAYEESETAKAEIDDLNTRIYRIVGKQNEPESLPEEDRTLLYLWQKGREVSMEEFNRIFALLGTSYDFTFFDSDTTGPGLDAVKDAVERGVLEESEGAIIYPGEKKGLHTLVFVTSRGTPTYETKDVGLAFLKEMRMPTDEVVILTAVEQQGHFKVVLAALSEIAPTLAAKTHHASHGLLTLTTGKMSSRKGNVITARELIQDIVEKATERNQDPVIAEQVAIGALKYMVLRSAPGNGITFDPDKSLSLDGDSGPYLQYAYVRAKKILEYGDGTGGDQEPEAPYAIERLMVHFPEIVARAERERAPHHVAQFLTELASAWNSFYASEQVLGSPEEAYKQRVAKAFARTMQNGLWLLGIPVPERM
jgi:arginyl-tRNA synthetase